MIAFGCSPTDAHGPPSAINADSIDEFVIYDIRKSEFEEYSKQATEQVSRARKKKSNSLHTYRQILSIADENEQKKDQALYVRITSLFLSTCDFTLFPHYSHSSFYIYAIFIS